MTHRKAIFILQLASFFHTTNLHNCAFKVTGKEKAIVPVSHTIPVHQQSRMPCILLLYWLAGLPTGLVLLTVRESKAAAKSRAPHTRACFEFPPRVLDPAGSILLAVTSQFTCKHGCLFLFKLPFSPIDAYKRRKWRPSKIGGWRIVTDWMSTPRSSVGLQKNKVYPCSVKYGTCKPSNNYYFSRLASKARTHVATPIKQPTKQSTANKLISWSCVIDKRPVLCRTRQGKY